MYLWRPDPYGLFGEHEVLNEDFTTKSTPAISPFLWGGSLYEPETGLYWMRNRYYHKGMHRFINQDPIGIWGDANNLGNGFAYAAGMVIEASDPTGLWYAAINGVDISDLNELFEAIETLVDQAYNETYGVDTGAPITDGKSSRPNNIDGTPSRSSHPWGGAVDVRTGGGTKQLEFARKVRDKLKQSFGDKWSNMFQIIVESPKNPKKKYPFMKGEKGLQSGNGSGDIVNIGCWKDVGAKINYGTSDIFPEPPEDPKEDPKVDPEPTKAEEEKLEPAEEKKDVELVLVETEIEVTETYWEEEVKDGKATMVRKTRIKKRKLRQYAARETGIGYPVPGGKDPADKIQNLLMQNLLSKMLKRDGSGQPPVFTDTSTGPNGVIMFYRNPYYVNKDPMKSIFFNGDDGRGRPIIIRNPFAPKDGVLWSNTYEMWKQRGIIQPEVDPWE